MIEFGKIALLASVIHMYLQMQWLTCGLWGVLPFSIHILDFNADDFIEKLCENDSIF